MMQMKAHGAEQRYLAKWQQLLGLYLKNYEHYSRKQEQKHISLLFILSMGYVALLASGIYLVFTNRMTVGELMACQLLFLSFNDALRQKNKFFIGKQQMESDLQYLADISHFPLHPKIATLDNNKSKPIGLSSIELIDLTFGYSAEFKPILNKVNLTIKAGAHVAIVGASGSGKSTLVHLLSGLYQPWSGTILINGIPLLDYSMEERASLIGVVSQQQFFYQGSIRDNLCLWHEHYSDNELLSVLKMACIDDVIAQTDDALDYQLTEGATNLSGGQRQRLELARTLLAQPPILILDEATSSLDPIIEERIKKNLTNYVATKIVIAHRFNTIHDAQTLYLLDKGQLVNTNLEPQNNTSDSFTRLFTTAG
jgi:ABC-type bacteriocin/lantibiotic exporter with double-glycine peptidase domain